jgi:uncharacterized membrane protein
MQSMNNRRWDFERYVTSKRSFAAAALLAVFAVCLVVVNWDEGAEGFSLAAGIAGISAYHLWLGMRARRRERGIHPEI